MNEAQLTVPAANLKTRIAACGSGIGIIAFVYYISATVYGSKLEGILHVAGSVAIQLFIIYLVLLGAKRRLSASSRFSVACIITIGIAYSTYSKEIALAAEFNEFVKITNGSDSKDLTGLSLEYPGNRFVSILSSIQGISQRSQLKILSMEKEIEPEILKESVTVDSSKLRLVLFRDGLSVAAKNSRKILSKMDDLQREEMSAINNIVKEKDIGAIESEIIGGVSKTLSTQISIYRSYYTSQAEMYDSLSKLYDFLASNRDRYRLSREGNIAFDDTELIRRHNEIRKDVYAKQTNFVQTENSTKQIVQEFERTRKTILLEILKSE